MQEGSQDKVYRMTYGWKRIECHRCHDIRIAGVVCPTCGLIPDAREVDPERQRRQRLARTALSALRSPETMPDDMADWAGSETFPDQLMGGLGEWLGLFFDALGSDPREPTTEQRIVEAIRKLLQYRTVVSGGTQLRPWLPLWRTAEKIVDALAMTARHFLEASSAETPLIAQVAARAGQQAMDEAAELAGHLADQLDRWERVSEAERMQDILPALAVEAYRLAGVEDLLALEAAGAAIFQELTGSPECPPGVGFTLQVFKIQAETVLDQERFMAVTRQLYSELTRDSGRLERLLRDPNVAKDLQDGHERAYDAAVAAQAVLAVERPARQEVRAMLGLALNALEGPGKRYVAALLAIVRNDDYSRLRRQDARALLDQAKQRGLGRFLEGLDEALRKARAYEDFLYEQGIVILTDHGEIRADSERLSVPRLVDRILASQETLLALATAFSAVAASHDIELVGADFFERLGLSQSEIVEMMLRVLNWSDVVIELDSEAVRVEGTVQSPRHPLYAVATMLSFLPLAGRMEIVAHTSNGSRRLTGPLEPWRRWQASQGLEKELAFVEAMRNWTIDDQAVWSAEQLRKYVAIRALQEFGAGYPACVRPLRELRRTALNLGETDLATALGSLVSLAREAELGPVDEKLRSRVVDALSAWALQDLPDPFELYRASR
jgi:hypothetical protein